MSRFVEITQYIGGGAVATIIAEDYLRNKLHVRGNRRAFGTSSKEEVKGRLDKFQALIKKTMFGHLSRHSDEISVHDLYNGFAIFSDALASLMVDSDTINLHLNRRGDYVDSTRIKLFHRAEEHGRETIGALWEHEDEGIQRESISITGTRADLGEFMPQTITYSGYDANTVSGHGRFSLDLNKVLSESTIPLSQIAEPPINPTYAHMAIARSSVFAEILSHLRV